MTTCTRIIEWDAAHRVHGHEGKCRHLHGHRYRAEITCEAPELDEVGRVIDFSAIKAQVGGRIDMQFDHGTILWKDDPLVRVFNEHMPDHKLAVMQENPTAENIAACLSRICDSWLPENITVVRVVVWETPNCYATWTRS